MLEGEFIPREATSSILVEVILEDLKRESKHDVS